ncbi:unnamed protein product [Musa acuminata subsp. burmannicoides]
MMEGRRFPPFPDPNSRTPSHPPLSPLALPNFCAHHTCCPAHSQRVLVLRLEAVKEKNFFSELMRLFQEQLLVGAASQLPPLPVQFGSCEGGEGALRAVSEMSYGSSSITSGAKTPARTFEYGRTHVVRPKGRHLATVVWLHGLGDHGASWSQLLETLPLPNIKWICPTAPTRPVAVFGGFPSNAWFDVGDLSESGPEDIEGMDASAAHIANLLSAEPADIKLGVGGFSMGTATALYSATCCAYGKYGSGKLYPVNLSAVVGLSGWLPCARSLKNKLEVSQDAARRTSSLPILLCHGKGISSYIDMQMSFIILHIKTASLLFFQDACFAFLVLAFYFHGIRDDVVLYKHGEKSSQVLKSVGFENVTFKTYNGLGHYTVPGEMEDVCKFLVTTLGLDGSYS